MNYWEEILRLRDLLIQAFQFPVAFLKIASLVLPLFSIFFSVLGFLQSMKSLAPIDPIASLGLNATNN